LIVDDYLGLIDSLAAPLATVEEQIAARAQPGFPGEGAHRAARGWQRVSSPVRASVMQDVVERINRRRECLATGF
jgi:acyl-CoA reductase-like NAD-dependent aldehyde dehydrogenase